MLYRRCNSGYRTPQNKLGVDWAALALAAGKWRCLFVEAAFRIQHAFEGGVRGHEGGRAQFVVLVLSVFMRERREEGGGVALA